MATFQEKLKWATHKLERVGIENPNIDAWYLLASVSTMTRSDYFLHSMDEMPESQSVVFQKFIERRVKHEPMQYIIGEQEFMGLNFLVNENVLIPRQDTEILVELVMKECNDKTVLDVCTGSGCIAISLAKLTDAKSVTALDISSKALELAAQNAKKNEVEVSFIQSNMFESVNQKYDVIVSNPPYIPTDVIKTLMPEVKDFEPMLALDGTEDGLKFYRILAQQSKDYLTKSGMVYFEIGCEQADDVCELLKENGYDSIKVTKDYANLNRVVSARLKDDR
ncbi:MAG: peptide chain release factor N(5)-glutamine methyltransferase [Clostridiales bacterium]|nr:peptide chain release factor N(5)-glutamine methyltransferase [Clostridiales bacterium]